MENVMLTETGHVRLIDLGLAIKATERMVVSSRTGSLVYMAPVRLIRLMIHFHLIYDHLQ